jgi:hypothetical protein
MIFLANGDGTFQPPLTTQPGLSMVLEIKSFDFNHDGQRGVRRDGRTHDDDLRDRPHTKTSVGGRSIDKHGHPIKIGELIATLDGVAYVARGAVHTPAAIKWTKQCLRDAFQSQLDGKGFSLVEILTMCPTDWFVPPEAGPSWLDDNLKTTYPLRVIKVTAPSS